MWIPRDLLRIPFVEVVERPEEMAEEPMSRRVMLPVRTRRSLRSAGLSVTIARGVVNVTAFTGVGITALTTVGDFALGPLVLRWQTALNAQCLQVVLEMALD